jgi:tetratricopeptide (TPR) repeat protein
MKSFFGNLFGGKQEVPRIEKHPEPAGRKAPERGELGLYKTGDVIGGNYEVLGCLGKGGVGVVYLVYARDIKERCALKTFRDELLADSAARDAFKKEALLWVNLEQHPFILAALWVTEVSGRLFVMMQHVAPDARGRVSLADHLARAGGPLDANQTLKWSIQFCLGMEHAQARGITSHRDIKPANILITQDGTVKISDFGLATAAEVAWRGTGGRGGSLVTRGSEGNFGLSLMQTAGKARCGTPGYMAPEIYRGEEADIRSDIYSFGLVLWQMAAGSPVPPFLVPYQGDMESYLRQIYEQQMTGRVPRVDGFFGPVIECCLCPKPAERYGSFEKLRGALEPILTRKTGEKIEVPQVRANPAAFLNNKGASLAALGRHQEAIRCLDKALALDPRDAYTWLNKGGSLAALGRREEAINCYDKALALDPREAKAWNNKGSALNGIGRWDEAVSCYDQALAIDPRYAGAWSGKGNALGALGRHQEAISCHDRALAIEPAFAAAWLNKGNALYDLGRHAEAISCFDQALAIDPRKSAAWFNKALSEQALGRRREAVLSYRKFIEVAPPHDAQSIAVARQRVQELEFTTR